MTDRPDISTLHKSGHFYFAATIGPLITTCHGISPAEALYGRDRFSYLLKEKILAAQRAGITTIMIPRRNAKDLEDAPAEARDKLKFVLLDTVDDALRCAVGIEP